MRPILYNANETAFETYGLGEIDATKAQVTRERNGNYTLYIEYPASGQLAKVFKNDMRVKSDAGLRTKNQTFFISRILKDSTGILKIYAKHISHLTKTMAIRNNTVVSGTAQSALAIWASNTLGGIRFDTWSDIDLTSKASWNIADFKTARDVLGGVQGSILDVWGGEYEFDNTTIRLHKQLGRRSPIVLEYGRNILRAEDDQDIESAYTSVYPYAMYTPETQGGGDGAVSTQQVTVELPEKYVDGPYMGLYNERRVLIVDFSSNFKEKEVPTVDKLRKLAKDYAINNRLGLPKINTKIEYVDLSKTLDYKLTQILEEAELCDIVPIYYPEIGLTSEDAKLTTIVYDVLLEQNDSVEVGAIGDGFKSSMTSNLSGKIDDIASNQQRLVNTLPNYLINAQGNKVWYNRPDNSEHKVGDIWFEKNGLYNRMYIWNGSQWEKRIDTEDVDKIKKEVNRQLEEAKTTTDRAIEQANATAREALEKAGTLPNTDSLSAKIKEEILKSKELGDKINRTFTEMDNGTEIFNKISGQVTKKLVEVKGEVEQKITQTNQRIGEVSGSVNSSLYTLNNRVGDINNGLNKAKIDIVNAQGTANNVGNKLILTDQKVAQATSKIDQTSRDLENTNAQVEANKRQIEIQVTNYNAVRESTKLFERILGTTEEGAPDKLSRLIMSSEIFQTEVGKYVVDDNNLIVNSETMDQNVLVNENRPGVNVSVNNGIFTIKAQGLTSGNWSGFTLPIYVRKIYKGETYSVGFKYRIRGALDDDFNVIIKNHVLNRAAFTATAGRSNSPVSDEWKEFQGTFYMSSDFEFGNHKYLPFYVYLTKNGWVEIKEAMLIRGSSTGPYKPSQFDDAFAKTKALESQLTSKIGEVSSATDSVRQLAYTAQNRAEQASSRSNSALDKAEDAKMVAGQATSLSQTAKQTALDAQQKAIQVAEQARQTQALAEATRTQVTQLAGSWAVRNLNSAGDVIGQINLNKDGSVKINEGLIVVGEKTLIKNGVIKSSMIEDLSADKIGAGRIDAEVVNIVNLNADNVTSGTFRGLVFEGGIVRGNNGNTVIDLNNNVTSYNGTAKIEFKSAHNSLEYNSLGRKAFLSPTFSSLGNYAAFAFGVNDRGEMDSNANFTGIKIFNQPNHRTVVLVGDVRIVKDPISRDAPAKNLAQLFYYINKNFQDLRNFRVANGEGSPGFYDVSL